MSHLFTAVTEAVFPCLEKVVGVFSGWHWIFKILALAAASIIAFIFSSVQVTLRPERDSLLMPRRILRFVCCLLPAWYVMRHFPLEGVPTGAWSVLLAIGFLLSGFLILWFLLTRCIWRIPQFLFNLAAFLLLGVLFGRIKSGFLGGFLLLLLALVAFFFSHIMDTESGKPDSQYKRPVKPEPASGSRTESVPKPDPKPAAVKQSSPAKPASAKEPSPKPAAKPTASEAPAAKPVPVPVTETADHPAPAPEKPKTPKPLTTKPAAEKPAPAPEKPKVPETPAVKPAAEKPEAPAPKPIAPEKKPAPAPEKPKAPAPKPAAPEKKPAPAAVPSKAPVLHHPPVRKSPVDTLPNRNVCIIGPYQSGKTSLAAAISKVLSQRFDSGLPIVSVSDLDSMKEEKEWKQTIELSSFEARTADTHFTLFDCPGDQKYIRKTMAALSQCDLAILVLPAGKTPNRQFEKLLLALGLFRRPFLLFRNLIDPDIPDDVLDMQEEELDYLLVQYGTEDLCLTYSLNSAAAALEEPDSVCGDEILRMMQKAEKIPVELHYSDRPFHMPVLQSFVPAAGTDPVAAGCIQAGMVSVGDVVEIGGLTQDSSSATVLQIQSFGRDREDAEAGDSVGLLLHTDSGKPLRQGQALYYPGTRTMQSTERFLLHASFERMEGSIPRLYSSGMEVMVQAGTACVPGYLEYTVEDHGDFPIQSGEDTDVYIALTRPLLLKPGDPVLLYEDWFPAASGLVTSVR